MILSIDTATATRAHLWEVGFRPVPIHNWDAKGPSPGKRPLGDNWRESALKDPPFCVTIAAVWYALNTGILCDGLRAIDIDIDDPVLAARVGALAIEWFGLAPVRTRRNTARCLLLYRAAAGHPRKIAVTGAAHTKDNGCKVEALGAGQQFVAFGRHDSGADLEWTTPPGEIRLADLPTIAEPDLIAFLAEVAVIIGAEPPRYANGQDGDHHTATEPQADPLRVCAAVAAIANTGAADWEGWNRFGMAIWAATGGSVIGGELFNEWSKRHPAYDEAATLERWRHYQRSPPTQIGAGTLFHMAGNAFRRKDETPGRDNDAPLKSNGATNQINALGLWDAGDDDYVIPPRGWLLGTTFCRRFLSSLLADGGVGKTALRVAQLMSLASGRSLTGEHLFTRAKVLIISLEDDRDELRRRVYAVLRHWNMTPEDVKGWLFLAAPKGMRIAELQAGMPAAGKLEGILRETIAEHGIDLVSLDPFVKSHGLEENSNSDLDYVCTLLAKIAIEYDCAIDLPHHTRKGIGTPGDADRGRGGSSMKDAARLVDTLTPMTTAEAEQFGVSEAERRFLIRKDGAKVNIAPPSSEAIWFRLVGVPLDNGAGLYPAGDNVQTVERWHPPQTWADAPTDSLNRILDDIDEGLPNGRKYSHGSAAIDRAAWKVVVEHLPAKTEAQAREIIAKWIKEGVLVSEDYDDPEARKTRKGLRVNHLKRPS